MTHEKRKHHFGSNFGRNYCTRSELQVNQKANLKGVLA